MSYFSKTCLFLLLASQILRTEAACETSAGSCDLCFSRIEPGEECGWCAQMNFTGSRCGIVEDLMNGGCGGRRIERRNSPSRTAVTTITQAEPLSSEKLISPQKARVQVDEVLELPFQVRAIKRWVIVRVTGSRGIQAEVTAPACRRFRWRNGRGRCSGTRGGQTVEFILTVRTSSCSISGRVTVTVPGSRAQKLIIKVDSSCSSNCPCSSHPQSDAPQCSYSGVLTCGQCQCLPGYSGKYCECNLDEDIPDACRPTSGSAICSGRGLCKCGICDCRSAVGRFYGRYCECDDLSCEYSNGAICGGPDHGACHCGQCVCRPGYVGESCGMQSNPEQCRAVNGALCNGKGNCVHGTCVCQSGYQGRTCEECPSCPGKCNILKDCVSCIGFSTGPFSQIECYQQCRVYGIQIVDRLQGPGTTGINNCQFRDDDDCLFRFTYQFDDDGELDVRVNIRKQCPAATG